MFNFTAINTFQAQHSIIPPTGPINEAVSESAKCAAFFDEFILTIINLHNKERNVFDLTRLLELYPQRNPALSGYEYTLRYPIFNKDGRFVAFANLFSLVVLDTYSSSFTAFTAPGYNDFSFIQFHDANNGEIRLIAGQSDHHRNSPDQKIIALDIINNRELFTMPENDKTITNLSICKDNTNLLISYQNGYLAYWNIANLGDTGPTLSKVVELVSKGTRTSILRIAQSPDGTKIATISQSRKIHLWDASTHQEIKQSRVTLDNTAQVFFAKSNDSEIFKFIGNQMLIFNRAPLLFWDTKGNKVVKTKINADKTYTLADKIMIKYRFYNFGLLDLKTSDIFLYSTAPFSLEFCCHEPEQVVLL